jgi:hypothetical protein
VLSVEALAAALLNLPPAERTRLAALLLAPRDGQTGAEGGKP